MWTILHICDISFRIIQGNLIQYSPRVNLIWNWQKLSLNHRKAKRCKWHENTSSASQYWKYFYFRSALRSLTTFWKTLITKWQDNYICVFFMFVVYLSFSPSGDTIPLTDRRILALRWLFIFLDEEWWKWWLGENLKLLNWKVKWKY